MRMLFVSTYFPTDFRTDVVGVYKRMKMLIDAIKEIAQIDMLFYIPPKYIDISLLEASEIERSFSQYWNTKINLFLCPKFILEGSSPQWQHYTNGIFNFFKQSGDSGTTSGVKQIQAFEECLSRKPDAVFVHRLQSMCPAMLTRKTLPPIFFDLDDIEHIAFLRKISQPPRKLKTSLYYLLIPALCWGERRAISLADQTFVCSKQDRGYLTKRWRLPGIVTVPNAINIPEPQPITSEPTLLLLGGYDYYPNVSAANFLIELVWPLIHRAMPEARLIIAGKEPSNIRGYRGGVPGVEFTDFVDDLDTLYQRSRVVCCPIFSGGGTRVKMIEAAAYGKPIVATRVGAEGIEMSDGREFLLRDEPELFAEACLHLLSNYTLCEHLGTAARTAVIKHYDRADIVKLIQKIICNGTRNVEMQRHFSH